LSLAQAFDVFRTAIDKVTYRNQQITQRVKTDPFQLVHQQRMATMQIANNPDVAPVAPLMLGKCSCDFPSGSAAQPADIRQVSRIVKGGDVGRLNFDLALAARRHAEDAALHYFGEKTLHSHHPAKLSN
jgi:hypothetical protein